MREMVLSSLGAEMLVQINSSREIHKREKREGKKKRYDCVTLCIFIWMNTSESYIDQLVLCSS